MLFVVRRETKGQGKSMLGKALNAHTGGEKCFDTFLVEAVAVTGSGD